MVKDMQVPAIVCYTGSGPACKTAICCRFKAPLTIDDVVRISAETRHEPEEFAALYVRSIFSEEQGEKAKKIILDKAEVLMEGEPGFSSIKESGYFDVVREEAARQLNFSIDQKKAYTGFILKGKNYRNNVYTIAEADDVEDECIFLEANRCSINRIKPLACRTYPYEGKSNSKRAIIGFNIEKRCTAPRKGYLNKQQLINLINLTRTKTNKSIFYISMQELCLVPDNINCYTREIKEEQYQRIKQEVLIPRIQSYKHRIQRS